jgi:hypothetical protein
MALCLIAQLTETRAFYVLGPSVRGRQVSPFYLKPIMLFPTNIFKVKTVVLPAVVSLKHVWSNSFM